MTAQAEADIQAALDLEDEIDEPHAPRDGRAPPKYECASPVVPRP